MRDRPLWLTVMAISYFWFLGAAVSDGPAAVGQRSAATSATCWSDLMVTCLAIGIGAGSMLAGRLSGDKVETRAGAAGLDPDGRVQSRWLYAARGSYRLSVVDAGAAGLASGLFIVPLNAYLQQRSESARKGPHDRHQQLPQHDGHAAGLGGVLWLCTTGCTSARRKLILIFGFVTPWHHRLHRDGGARFPDPLRAVAASRTPLPHPHRGPGERAVPRAGAAGGEPHVARGWLPDRRVRAALHPLHGVEALLRAEGAATGSSA